jgi:glucose-1-phosphate thymidylyltransferase
MNRKGLILSGGSGTRLYPVTKGVSKQMLPIYDKPMIYYPLSVLMLTGIQDILIITTKEDLSGFKRLLGNGSEWGINLEYAIQDSPDGLVQAFIIGEEFIGNNPCVLVLGDNIFFGSGFQQLLHSANKRTDGATIFSYRVHDPERYGVVEFDKNGKVLELIEKPENPKSSYAVTGLYFYDKNVVEYAKKIIPSVRGELEITDLNKLYLKEKKLSVEVMNRGYVWLDTGTNESLLNANHFIHAIEKSHAIKIACLEEIAFNNKWINLEQLDRLSSKMEKSAYGLYLKQIISEAIMGK